MSWHGTDALVAAHLRRGDLLLARIDAHLERGITDTSPEHLARGAELEARLEHHLAIEEEFFTADREPYDAWRFAMRRDSLRSERALGEISQTLVKRTHDFVRYFADEGPAHRDALCRILDEFDRADGDLGPGWPATAPSFRG